MYNNLKLHQRTKSIIITNSVSDLILMGETWII